MWAVILTSPTLHHHVKPLLSSITITEDLGEGAPAPHRCGQGTCSSLQFVLHKDGADAPEHRSATNTTVPGRQLLNLYLLWSQPRNKPKVESTTLGFPCPFQDGWRYWHSSASEQSVVWFRNQWGEYSEKTHSFVKLHVGERKRMGREKEKKEAKQPWAMTLTQPYFSRSEEIFFGCTTPAQAGNMGVFFC